MALFVGLFRQCTNGVWLLAIGLHKHEYLELSYGYLYFSDYYSILQVLTILLILLVTTKVFYIVGIYHLDFQS